MTPKEITHHRLRNQQIALTASQTPEDVVAKLGAMQAQDYGGALWAIGLRLPKTTEVEIEKAIARRAIVRTWPMRGTLHFVAAADVHWMLKFLTPRIVAGAARRRQQLELDDATFVRCEKVFVRALQGGKQLTREEMFISLERAKIAVDNHRGYHILWRLAQERLLCFGARQGKQQTFTLLDEWVPTPSKLEREAALAELARRYFTSHGPATLQDFVWWSGLKVSEAREGLEAVSPRLIKEIVDGKVYWMLPDMPASSRASTDIYLLPAFDEYMLGYQDRGAALDPRHAPKIVPGGNGIFLPTIISNGRVVGTWKRAFKKKAVVVMPSPFTSLTKAETRAVAGVAERYGQFLKPTASAL